MPFTPKSSIATQLWLGILATVLVVLFLETGGKQQPGRNFYINTDSNAEGASVVVDGVAVGTVGSAGRSGMGGGSFWGYLTTGEHSVELRKVGFQPFKKTIDMHGEEYLGVDLKPARN